MGRQSNIELLRLIIMFFVLVLHTNYLSIGEPHINEISSIEFIIRNFIESFNFIAVIVFVLISGYFSIRLKRESIANYIFIVIFYSVGLRILWLLGSIIFDYKTNIPYFIESFFFLSNSSWFVLDYLMLMLFSPMLNLFVEHTSKKSLLVTIVIILFVSTWFGILGKYDLFGCNRGYSSLAEYENGFSFLTFITIYLIGRYIKLYVVDRQYKMRMSRCVLSYFLWGGLTLTLSLAASYLGKGNSVVYTYSNPAFIFAAISFFLMFLKLRINSSIINKLAVSTFAVYLIHSNPVIIYKYIDWFKFLHANNSFFMYLLYVFISCLVIFMVSILLDQVRIYMYNKFIAPKLNKI